MADEENKPTDKKEKPSDKDRMIHVLSSLHKDESEGGVDIRKLFETEGQDELSEQDLAHVRRIRDKLITNKLVAFPVIGDQWKVVITWHEDGGVDFLNKPDWVFNRKGNIRSIYWGLKNFRKHAVTVIVSVFGGLILFFIVDIFIKPRLQSKTPVNINTVDSQQNKTKSQEPNSQIDTTLIDSMDTVK